MVLPPFRGPRFLREAPGLTDAKGFIPVLPTYRHPDFDSIYAVGVVTQLKPFETTSIPIGVPKVGQMTEGMVMSVAHNVALELGVLAGQPLKPSLQAICFADFGHTGALFLAIHCYPIPQLVSGIGQWPCKDDGYPGQKPRLSNISWTNCGLAGQYPGLNVGFCQRSGCHWWKRCRLPLRLA